MKKLLFLEYKFGDFKDEDLLAPKPAGVMVAFEELNNSRVEQIKRLDLEFGISFVVFPTDRCPVDPESINFAKTKIKNIIPFDPQTI